MLEPFPWLLATVWNGTRRSVIRVFGTRAHFESRLVSVKAMFEHDSLYLAGITMTTVLFGKVAR
jgi:hypothetical protein